MTHDELVALFKPDRYGFCRAREHRVWFDTVLRINDIINESTNDSKRD